MAGFIDRVKKANNSYNFAEYLPTGGNGKSFSSSRSDKCGVKVTISCNTNPSPHMSSGFPLTLGIILEPRCDGNIGEHDSTSKFCSEIKFASQLKVSSDWMVSIVSRAVKLAPLKASFSMCWLGMSFGVYPITFSDLYSKIAFESTYLCTTFISCIFFNPWHRLENRVNNSSSLK